MLVVLGLKVQELGSADAIRIKDNMLGGDGRKAHRRKQ